MSILLIPTWFTIFLSMNLHLKKQGRDSSKLSCKLNQDAQKQHTEPITFSNPTVWYSNHRLPELKCFDRFIRELVEDTCLQTNTSIYQIDYVDGFPIFLQLNHDLLRLDAHHLSKKLLYLFVFRDLCNLAWFEGILSSKFLSTVALTVAQRLENLLLQL